MADGPYAERLLRVAQASYNGTPAGCSKKYTNYKNAPTEYQDFIKNDLTNALQEEYGYNPEDVKGYYFPTTSDMSKSMAGDSDLKTYVKKYIKE